MKKEIIKTLTADFESCANRTENEIEFWFAKADGEDSDLNIDFWSDGIT